MNIKNSVLDITVRPENFDPLRFKWHLKNLVAGSAMPGRHGNLTGDLEKLKDEGIELIVNLTCTTLQIPPEYKKCFSVVHVPIVDGQPPDTSQLQQIMTLVHDTLNKGRRMVIHCRGGMGRTASIIIPLLMEFENLSLEEAAEKARKSGRFTQTSEQREFIECWAKSRAKMK